MCGREKVLKEKVPQIRRFRLVFAGIIRVLGFNSRVDFIFFRFFFSAFCGFLLLRNKLYVTITTRPMQQIKKGLIFFFRTGERGVTLATYSNEPELCGVGVVQSSISDTQRLEPTANDDGG